MLHHAKSNDGGIRQELGVSMGKCTDCTRPRERWGSGRAVGGERSQMGPEDKHGFNRPENTGKGLFREEII